ncbi:hypothetical protein R1sor_007953 [Riccia sorocarpa]|uniref:BHLH domain-containing protein n=1 Tax=Riccia sorocarpa TaxID=122646 RepID=A0ABD3HVF3_9MARC
MAATEYSYGWNPEIGVNVNLDIPFMEEKGGFGSFSQLGVVDVNHLYLPTSLSQWSTTDPAILQGSDQSAWNSSRQQQQQRMYQTATGGIFELSTQSPAAAAADMDVDISQTSDYQQQILLDAQQRQLPANSSNTSAGDGTRDSPAAGEIYPWMHQMIMNHFMTQQRICINDQMPALFSDCSAQQPCLYTSSSECVQDADSSGSSGARDNYTPAAAAGSSGVTACSSEVINWRNSDVGLQAAAANNNLVASSSSPGYPLRELYDDSSSIGHVDIPETKDQASGLGLVMQRYGNNPVALIERSPNVSWALPATESDAMTVNHCSTLDPQLLNIVGFQDMGSGLSSSTCQPPPYKRARLNNTSAAAAAVTVHMGVEPAATAITGNRPLIPSSSCSSFSRHRSLMGGRGSDYPMTSLKVADALYRDFNFPSRQQISPCSGSSFPQRGMIQDSPPSREGGLYGLRTGPATALADHDYSSPTTSNRKHNATSIEPQSVAARHRRKKISERIRVLEKLIPGGSKMDTASMLDEAVDYVKFLQLQVSLLEKLGELPENNASRSQLQTTTSPSSSPTMHGRPSTNFFGSLNLLFEDNVHIILASGRREGNCYVFLSLAVFTSSRAGNEIVLPTAESRAVKY